MWSIAFEVSHLIKVLNLAKKTNIYSFGPSVFCLSVLVSCDILSILGTVIVILFRSLLFICPIDSWFVRFLWSSWISILEFVCYVVYCCPIVNHLWTSPSVNYSFGLSVYSSNCLFSKDQLSHGWHFKRALFSKHHLSQPFQCLVALFPTDFLLQGEAWVLRYFGTVGTVGTVEGNLSSNLCRNPHKLDASGICRGKGREYFSTDSNILAGEINVILWVIDFPIVVVPYVAIYICLFWVLF